MNKEFLKMMAEKLDVPQELKDMLNKPGWEDITQDADKLRELGWSYIKREKLQPGDLVQWKPGMKNVRFPQYNEPAVLIEVLTGNRYASEDNSGSPKYMEPQDARIALVDPDGEFLAWTVDFNRLEPYKG